uniref:Uncharacterized protein n=1 Tax=Mycena chlorophos TaxID=658473 RepID=A0ABQ0L8Z8_MYCCL|nr:predicted protein [Mycena chlorophos]
MASSSLSDNTEDSAQHSHKAIQDLSPYLDSELEAGHNPQARTNDRTNFVVAVVVEADDMTEPACEIWTPSPASSSRNVDDKPKLPNRERDQVTDDRKGRGGDGRVAYAVRSERVLRSGEGKSAISRSAVVLADKVERNEL